MRVVIQRVKTASVTVNGAVVSKIGKGVGVPGRGSIAIPGLPRLPDWLACYLSSFMARPTSSVYAGLLCLVGLKTGDEAKDTDLIVRKILATRLFHDEEAGKRFKTSVVDEEGEILCISQFTLYGRAKSKSPDFSRSMGAAEAEAGYDAFLGALRKEYVPERVKDGIFGAQMDVSLINDGPVTLVIDSDGSVGISS